MISFIMAVDMLLQFRPKCILLLHKEGSMAGP